MPSDDNELVSSSSDEGPYVCCLPQEIQTLAYVELNEDPAIRDDALRTLRSWLKTQPHIRARTDNTTLLRYLRGCKFDVQRTQSKIETFYSCKTALPDMFIGRDPSLASVNAILHLGLMVPLPGYDALGRKVILGRLGAWNPSIHKPELLFKAASMLFDTLFMEDEQISVTGFVQLHDMAGFSLKHASSLTLPLIKKVMAIWTEGYSTRPKAVHYINTPPAFTPIFNIFKRFMKEKMKKRIMIHGSNLASMQKHVPKSMLPAEYGGLHYNLREITEEWVEKIESHRTWFLEDEQYKVTDTSNNNNNNKNKKPSHSISKMREIFGSDRSFKKLDLD